MAVGASSASAENSKASGRITIAYINDVHAQLAPHPELFWTAEREEYVPSAGGLARVALMGFGSVLSDLPTQMCPSVNLPL